MIDYPNKPRLPSIANLMSPPELKSLDSYRLTPSKSPSMSSKQELSSDEKQVPFKTPENKMRILPSPPTSPWGGKSYKAELDSHGHRRKGSDLKDPVLYADSEAGSNFEEPLFSEPVANTEELIDKHMAMHLIQFKNKLNGPTRDEYRLALSCVPQIGAQYNRDPTAYFKRQREEQDNEYHQYKRLCAPPGTKAAPVAIAPAPKPGKRPIKPATPMLGQPRMKRTPKASPLAKTKEYHARVRSSETPDRKPRVKREDNDYNSLPDLCPNVFDPVNHADQLRVQWQAQPLDLSDDPDRHLMHEAEVKAASTLRLKCAVYLTQKRRIFQSRLETIKHPRHRTGQNPLMFNKTDAQECTHIDVNKASSLWSGFERLGWLDPKHFEKHL